jgi:hypothetical protein
MPGGFASPESFPGIRLLNENKIFQLPSVGTMTVKALESVADETGYLSAADGYTRLHITSDRKPRSVDGLLPRSQQGIGTRIQFPVPAPYSDLTQLSIRKVAAAA